jgi:hypothetical protein
MAMVQLNKVRLCFWVGGRRASAKNFANGRGFRLRQPITTVLHHREGFVGQVVGHVGGRGATRPTFRPTRLGCTG